MFPATAPKREPATPWLLVIGSKIWAANYANRRTVAAVYDHSCPNYEMRFAPGAVPLPLGEGGAKRRVRAGNPTLIRPFIKASPFRARASPGPPSPRGRR